MEIESFDGENLVSRPIPGAILDAPIIESPACTIVPFIHLFIHRDTTLNPFTASNTGFKSLGALNNIVSSFWIVRGDFEFYDAENFGRKKWGPIRLGPGRYRWVPEVGIGNDSIMSIKAYYGDPTQVPKPKDPEPKPKPKDPEPKPKPEDPEPKPEPENILKKYIVCYVRPDSSCSPKGRTWFRNNHLTKSIVVKYTVSSVTGPPSPREIIIDPNDDAKAGCDPYNLTLISAYFGS